MAENAPSPELVEAYQLIKAGQRKEAGQRLKAYLATNKNDANAWWLMANTVQKPETVERCLQTVLKLNPNHASAQRKLQRLRNGGTASRPASRPQSQPQRRPQSRPQSQPQSRPAAPPPSPEPDEYIYLDAAPSPPAPGADPFGGGGGAAASGAGATSSDAAPGVMGGSFEDFLQQGDYTDPFNQAAPAADDPFGSATSEPYTPPTGSYNPFDSSNAFDPSAAAHLGGDISGTAQTAGSGNQPGWGPGLAFVSDAAQPSAEPSRMPGGAPEIDGARPSPPRPKSTGTADFDPRDFATSKDNETRKVETLIGYGLMAFAGVVLVGLLLYFLVGSDGGLFGSSVPDMRALDAATFTVDYPEDWDVECLYENMGYQVCGIANHSLYNEAEYYANQNIDLGSMMAEAFSMAFTGGDLPDEYVSIIIMDVPTTSPSFDNGSKAKTQYEWYQEGWGFWSGEADIRFTKQTEPPRKVNGHDAYYYEFVGEDREQQRQGWRGKEVYYDVYIPHDGIMLWMTVSIWSDIGDKDHHDTIQAIIDSIQIKPVEEWDS